METEKMGTLIVTKIQDATASLLLCQNRLIKASVITHQDCIPGDIYIARVNNVLKNIEAAFVEIASKTMCFLALKDLKNPLLLNREFDGSLRIGDELLVQVEKEAAGTKEPSVTVNLSFPGKYLVLTTQNKHTGFSKKLSASVRKKIAETLMDHSDDFGIVVRTNAGELTDFGILEREYEVLKKAALDVLSKARTRTCFTCLKSAPPAYLKDLRDLYSDRYGKIITDEPEIYESLKIYLEEYQPEDMQKLCFYQDQQLSLTSLYGLTTKLSAALSRKVWMKSGGYLIIEPTEALTVIDVNTGKFQKKRKLEETFFQINKEACEEISIQLQLRNLSGIVIIDFINMEQPEHKKELLTYLQNLVKTDHIKTDVIGMTALGLVEITRKKGNRTLAEQVHYAGIKIIREEG